MDVMDNYKKVKKVLWIILIANMIVALIKVSIGTIINSTSIMADGFHSLGDGSSNIVGLIGIHFASKPVDEDHPYGHGKFEMLTGLFIAGMLFMIGIKIMVDALSRFFNPTPLQISLQSLLLLLFTLCINIFVSQVEYHMGKKLYSQILISDSIHTRSDVYVSAGVLFTLLCIILGLPPVIDSIASLIVAVFILHGAYEIFRDNSCILLDQAAVDTCEIRNIVMSFDLVKDAHNIRSRGSQNELFIDMHIMTEPTLSVEKSHKLMHNIEEKIQEEIKNNVEIIIHLEPYNKQK